jgi:hypothetical protein
MLFANLQGFKIGVKVEMPKDKEPAIPFSPSMTPQMRMVRLMI